MDLPMQGMECRRVKPYYADDLVTLYHGDAEAVMETLPTASVDLVVTSPPYNLNRDGLEVACERGLWKRGARKGGLATGYGVHDDAMPQPEYEEWQRRVLTTAWGTLVEDGAIFYNHKPRVLDGVCWLPLVLNPGLPLRQIITWTRDSGMNFAPTHYLNKYEWILIFAKPAFRLRDRPASGVSDVWTIRPLPAEHPAPFPVGLPYRAIETTGADAVLDPFAGSGTTLRAAKDLGRKAIGIELEERYCEIAARRLAQEVLDLEAA